MAHKIVVLKQGEIVAEGTPEGLKSTYAYDQLAFVFLHYHAGVRWLEERQLSYTERQGTFTIQVESTLEALKMLKEMESLLASFEVVKGTMDDVFIRIMAKGGVDHDSIH